MRLFTIKPRTMRGRLEMCAFFLKAAAWSLLGCQLEGHVSDNPDAFWLKKV